MIVKNFELKKWIKEVCQLPDIRTRKNSTNRNTRSYLKLELICKLCSDKVEFQNLTQLRFHVERHEDSIYRDVYLELLQ